MASVSFAENASGNGLYLGGVAGDLFSSASYDAAVKNCANYGDLTHTRGWARAQVSEGWANDIFSSFLVLPEAKEGKKRERKKRDAFLRTCF